MWPSYLFRALLAVAAARGACASSLHLFDPDMTPASYTGPSLIRPAGQTTTANTAAFSFSGGGNPDGYRRIRYRADPFLDGSLVEFNTLFTWDFATQPSVFDFSFRADVRQPPTSFLIADNVRFYFALRQDGVVFRTFDEHLLTSSWQTAVAEYQQSFITAVSGVSGQLDFSPSGGVMEFGYLIAFDAAPPGVQLFAGVDVDNFCVVGGGGGDFSACDQASASSVPEPGSAWLLGSMIVLGGIVRRRVPRT